MEKTTKTREQLDALVLENVSKWQISKEPLAALNEDQLDVIYQVDDVVKNVVDSEETGESEVETNAIIDTFEEFTRFYIQLESDLRNADLVDCNTYYSQLKEQAIQCQNLFSEAEKTTDALNLLKTIYFDVTTKTNSLHSLSEMLMIDQKHLKDKKEQLNECLHHFIGFNYLYDSIERTSKRINDKEFTDLLDEIDKAIDYLNTHISYKESRIYRMKYESLLLTALNHVYVYVNNIITDAIKHVTEPENTSVLLNGEIGNDQAVESAFSLYYGKFQNAAGKTKTILTHIESKAHKHIHYENTVYDCQKTYFTQRSPIISAAVSKALGELKEQHKNDFSVLFRSSCLFVMKVCQDESMCFFYFFNNFSQQLSDYLAGLCQYLYDSLRPSLISINHLEILTELCSILRREMLNDQVHSNESLARFTDTVRQMLEDVEERLVFRTNVFFQHDLAGYKPSRGDLMYPEKLLHIEGILESESRAGSRNSIASLESHEVATINANPLASLRSYTGNSPADLHGMWYPTVKRTLVCLSRLYFCLDRQTFQGLAQEALAVCMQTIDSAAEEIAGLKTVIDGKLFQIKHLLIVREQIAPFQVDFTVTEMALDFSNVKNAAMGLISNRNKLFAFSSNNALLEFLLEGTPRVKEYLVDSRKEIDKHLKSACESFISYVTMLLVGNVVRWLQKAEKLLKSQEMPVFEEHDFLKPQMLAAVLSTAKRNIKTKVPEVQSSMQLYLANRETEFILFRPIKNNIVNTFMQMEEALSSGKYTADDLLIIGCPSAEQINVLLCSVSLVTEQDARSRRTSRASRTAEET